MSELYLGLSDCDLEELKVFKISNTQKEQNLKRQTERDKTGYFYRENKITAKCVLTERERERQCVQIWQNLATLAIIYKLLANF